MTMDDQEAIWRIEDHIRVHRIGEFPHVRLGEALRIAVQALQQRQQTKRILNAYADLEMTCETIHKVSGFTVNQLVYYFMKGYNLTPPENEQEETHEQRTEYHPL